MEEFSEYYAPSPSVSALSLRYAGRQACKPAHEHRGIRNHYLLHFIIRGKGRVEGGKLLGAGEAFIYPPGRRMRYSADRRSPWEYCWIGFDSSGDLCGVQPGFYRAENQDVVGFWFTELIQELSQRSAGSVRRATGYLQLIVGELVGEKSILPGGKDPDYTAAAVEFIHRNYMREIDVETVTRHIGLDRSYFSSLFHRQMGTTLINYLIDYRMKTAGRLLAETDYPVREVAASVGYPDYPAFARRFKARTGVSASEYRRMKS